MQNYLSGFFVSFILHLGLVLSFANFFQIDNLYSLNKVEPMPAYLVYEKPLVIAKKKNIKKVKELIQEEPIIGPTVLESANSKAEIETVKAEKNLLLKQILGEEIKKHRLNEKTVLMIDFLKEFIEFLGERKKYWLLPIILVLALFGVLIVLSQGSAVAPFIYTIF